MPHSRLRVLVADDEQDTTNSFVALLRINGYDAHGCCHPKDCLEAIERLRPQALLLDLGMPGMDGFAIARELKENPDLRPKLLIAITGHGTHADRQRTTEAGFDYHLVKPVDWNTLEAVLKTVILLRS